jgi:hypothetical protein
MSPTEKSVREVITKHFESRQYKVLELKIGEINNVELRDKRYMGVRGYIVDIEAIILEKPERTQGPDAYKKVDVLTFRDSRARIIEDPDKHGSWIVAHVYGIIIP